MERVHVYDYVAIPVRITVLGWVRVMDGRVGFYLLLTLDSS